MKFIQQQTKNTSWKGNKKIFIILHHVWVWCNWLKWTLKVFRWETSRQVSVHYLVDCKWKIYKFNTDDDILRHAWVSRWTTKDWNKFYDLNKYSIWIEVLSDWYNFTNEQRKVVKELIKHLMQKYWIWIDNILRHLDISWFRWKRDIWDNFWNTEAKTRDERKQKFLLTDYPLMTDYQKKLVLKSIYENNSSLRDAIEAVKDEIQTESLKDLLVELQKLVATTNKKMRELNIK